MTARESAALAFLDQAGWGATVVTPLAGDASNRRYDRLRHAVLGTAVLMDAPPEKGEDVRPFVEIGELLASWGFSAPRILSRDAEAGFLLIEDLGDDLFARVIAQDPSRERELYTAAVDLLVDLHKHTAPANLLAYDAPTMAALADLASTWYAPQTKRNKNLSQVIEPLLAAHAASGAALAMRDYHAENLLWLPDRAGTARVGLLDFQDAMAGHPGYDLVSLLKDARRDVSADLRAEMIARYIAATGHETEPFEAACAVLSAQRNLRIIGVFARLCLRDGKAHYVDLLPRVWAHLTDDLTHPVLAPLAEVVNQLLPPPTPEILTDLKARCAGLQTP